MFDFQFFPQSTWTAPIMVFFQHIVIPWKVYISQKLILPAETSQKDALNDVRVAYVNFYNMWILQHG